MDPNTKALVQKMIDTAITNASAFKTRKFGDTPQDVNQLVPKKYVDGKGTSPGGSSGELQYNNAGAFGGAEVVTYQPITGTPGTFYPLITMTGSGTGRYDPQLWIKGGSGNGGAIGSGQLRVSSATISPTAGSNYFLSTWPLATTGATVTGILVVASGFNATGKTVTYKATVNARRTGGSAGTAGDSAGYIKMATFNADAGTIQQIGTTQTIYEVESQPAWNVDIVISGNDLELHVTGAVNNTIAWDITLEQFYDA